MDVFWSVFSDCPIGSFDGDAPWFFVEYGGTASGGLSNARDQTLLF